MATPIKFANNAHGSLSASINNSVTTINLVSGDGAKFPSLGVGEFFYATLIKANNDLEIVKVTARNNDALTVVRNQESSGAKAFDAGDRIELRITAQAIADISNIDYNVPTTWTTASTIIAAALGVDNGSNDWTFEVSSNTLIFKYGGTGKMKLDSSGNLTVVGNVTAYGTI